MLTLICLALLISNIHPFLPSKTHPSQSSSIPSLSFETTCNTLDKKSIYNYQGVAMSGYLKLNKGNSVIAFVFYGKENASQQQLKNIPTILWLSGGPGVSSQLANLMEIGPFLIRTNQEQPFQIVRNPYAWTKYYNVLFIDQPIGTGLSYADPENPHFFVTNMQQMSQDLYFALSQLYESPQGCFNMLEIKGNSPLFVVGESYGGKYAPAISEKILREVKNGGFLTGLKGVAIGDGFVDPYSTLHNMNQYAYMMGLLDYQQHQHLKQLTIKATTQHYQNNLTQLYDSFFTILTTITNSTGVNMYDISTYKDIPFSLLSRYFNDPDVLKMYRFNGEIKFNGQLMDVWNAFLGTFMKSQVQCVENILNNYDIRVLVYAGQNDLITNTPGTLTWVQKLNFPSADLFRDTLLTPWKIKGQVKGFFKKAGKFELRTINNAGHFVPMTQPEVALDMLNSFVAESMGSDAREGQKVHRKQEILQQI